jgi:hypothetical protein
MRDAHDYDFATAARDLTGLSHVDLLVRFAGLEPPSLSEMDGEFAATLLDQGSRLKALVAAGFINAPGRWLCKAFRPVTESEGRGYNGFRGMFGAVRRHFSMRTFVGTSTFDGRPSYILDYSPYNWGLMRTMRDEVRRVAPGVYLGIGRVGANARLRAEPFPFLLEGPVAPFADD